MESWRARGFVPDSDEDDGLDSQDKVTQDVESSDDELGNLPKLDPLATTGIGAAKDEAKEENQRRLEDANAGHDGADMLLPSEKISQDDTELAGHSEDNEDEDTPVGKKQDTRPSPILSGSSPPSTPRARQQIDIWDIPSSSPDELQLVDHFPRRQASLSSNAHISDKPREDNGDMELSPLSSPLSSLHSLRLDEDEGNTQEEHEDPPPQDNPGDLLPPFEIPEDVLRELSQPTRRSLRQRNPIQLHPYLLEDAKYQRLMKARGVKPVRIAQYQQALRAAAEAHGQSFDSTLPPSSSPAADFEFDPPSPVQGHPAPQRTDSQDGRQPYSQHPHLSESESRSPKRRKVAKPDGRQPLSRPRPRVVIHRTSAGDPDSNSIWDIPPSPPRSGSVSSPHTLQNPNVFRFPRGFTPPTLDTPSTAARSETKDGDSVIDGSAAEVDEKSADVQSVMSWSQPNSDVEAGEGVEEVVEDNSAVRELQRKIKGVLPASWLRLDQQRHKEKQLSSTQRDHEKLARLESAKGVAKKITKKSDSVAMSSSDRHLASLRDLADSEGSEDDSNDRNQARQILANLVGFDDPFSNENIGEDIPEDNRIDYMFPSVTRGHAATKRQSRAKKRPRLDGDASRIDGFSKRPRLKRQARLTDPMYKRERKRPSSSLPRLGILDAPDVASRPRNQQPHFLRIAARKARSRRDCGRRSPSGKVFQLSSRLDTEDANTSLREWRTGRIRQTKLPKAKAKHPVRRPLVDASANKRFSSHGRDPWSKAKARPTAVQMRAQPEELNDMGSQPSNPDPLPSPEPEAHERPTGLAHLGRQGHNWVVRRNVVVSSLKRNTPRPVGAVMADSNIPKPTLSRMPHSLLGQSLKQAQLPKAVDRNLVLNRFLSGMPAVGKQPGRHIQESDNMDDSLPKEPVQIRRHTARKRAPKRLDVNTTMIQMPLTLSPDPDPEPSGNLSGDAHSMEGLAQRLSGFQRSYSIDFSISPLTPGTFFHETTFIGSGEFKRSLEVGKRDLDKGAGLLEMQIGNQFFSWGSWNDSVSSNIGIAFETMIQEIELSDHAPTDTNTQLGCGRTIYRRLVKYVTETLAFVDPIDRVGFVTRSQGLVSRINDALEAMVSTIPWGTERLTEIASYNLVFANFTYQVACHELVSDSIAGEVLESLKSVSERLLAFILNSSGESDLRKFTRGNELESQREKGIRDGCTMVEAFVVLRHVLRSADRLQGYFESLIVEALLPAGDLNDTMDIKSLENGWGRLFAILPLCEIDNLGIARVGSRFSESHDNWTAVKRLMVPVLDSYQPNSSTPISYNNYCRVLFHRCFHLIEGWGWRDCKMILDVLYDFYAKNTLYNLKQEDNYSSPSFLDDLDSNPSLEVLPGDPCFHIFLKIIARGLRSLSKKYDKKKVRNFAWRLLPNHGKVYPKEKPIHQTDLDALRNHHDLLCTLYYAVPDGCRPRLAAIINLVDPANSHRETCNISLRAWTRLVRFQLSTKEDVTGLEPFAAWHHHFVTEFIKQHALARREIEAQNTGDNQFSHQVIERTISQNQRQIESLLKTAVNSLENAIQLSPTLDHAYRLVSQSPINALLGLFNPKASRVNATVSEALDMANSYVRKCNSSVVGSANPNPSAPVDEDSQEYGDWTALEAMYEDELAPAAQPLGIDYLEKELHPAVSRLVSNCFGEDHCPEDEILLSVVDCWSSIAQTLVKYGLRHWDGYLSLYNGDSWAALRVTEQTRKFTPKFLASCIEKDVRFISDCRLQVYGMWLSSLMERVSMLKFQHSLTEALLNCEPVNPLLQNLPFIKGQNGRYSLTLEDLCQCRLSLVSCVLSNMREHLQDLEDAASRSLGNTKHEYRELIQKMMTSMKSNYQELGSSATGAQGAYVDFVHRVVGFLQQHTRDICPIDPFFTDPSSFPLPSTDPTYIVARMKGYEPKLSSEKVAKTLIMFVQGISERAAIDGQQVYLVDQLYTSMTNTYEAGDAAKPTLRATLMQCVFPAYLEMAFSNPGAWLLSRPIVQTITLTFKELLFNIDTTDANCVASVMGIFFWVFGSSYKALYSIVENANLLREPAVVITATAFVEMITSTLRVVDYIDRATDAGEKLISQIHALRQVILVSMSFLQDQLPSGIEDITAPAHILADTSTSISTPNFFTEVRLSATRELQTYINESWSRHQDKYYFTRRGGHQPQEIGIEPSVAATLENSPAAIFVETAQDFLNTLNLLDSFDTSI